ncbi:MAG: Vms1/Ankzf1 family peptidyl-tRNA hydrolase [Halodesulfurarchaeum sp.]|nr:Vms1/Ankzf1 family peptidyl-tRNA hydrolase [Halodesulfurarchaeum sp.]
MLDRVLGRAALKERIESLEEAAASLEAQLESAQERRKEAVRNRQEAEREVNRLEDRVTELEDRVERAESGSRDVEFRGKTTLRGDRLEAVLSRLESLRTEQEGAMTAMVTGSVPDPVRDLLGDRSALVSRAAPALVLADDAELVTVALRPPAPPEPFLEFGPAFRIDRAWFQPRGRYTLALVRSDLFAMGTYEDGHRVSFAGFESDVKGDHSKGGFSQARFERRRDQQIDDHLDRVSEALTDAGETRYVVGESTLLPEFAAEATVTKPVDATGSPREALEDAHDRFWRTKFYRL